MKEIFIYSFIVYGLTNIFVWGSNLQWWRNFLALFGTGGYSLYKLFTCFMCLPTWMGPVISTLIILFSSGTLSPTFGYVDNIWLVLVLDGFFASGIVWFINTIQEYLEGNTPSDDEDETEEEDN